MKLTLFAAIVIAIVTSACATQALVQKSSCADVAEQDELLCKKVKAVFR